MKLNGNKCIQIHTTTESNGVRVTACTGIGVGATNEQRYLVEEHFKNEMQNTNFTDVDTTAGEQCYLADEFFRNDTPNTIFKDVNTTADINENKVSATTSIQDGNNLLFFKQI
jgi:hypothetical protein